MTTTLTTPQPRDLATLHGVLSQWQGDRLPLQLHPGDLGWYGLRGEEATAAALRLWAVDDTIAAIALLDGDQLLRFAIDPALRDDEHLAERIAADADDPTSGLLRAGDAVIEARGANALGDALEARGWVPDELWTPLHRDLRAPVEVDGLRVRSLEPQATEEWALVHWSAFRGTPIPEDRLQGFVAGWRAVAQSPLSRETSILALKDDDNRTVAIAATWAAGAGRPGIVEPMGVHADHRGRGYGVLVTRAAAAALRERGASSARVAAESSNAAAVATYTAAGFTAGEEVADWARTG
ncbi:GNAT family N-acetyltransferase [Janibacter melonis]|uniref:GNAT family N-acetyltransferase n=1 Tax=Janibacter melonis TaxID=262209 RepID=UPI0017489F31|nr:GNAT family N-acetyltransferase [Janibacter melonis]